jgi:ComF family protein
LPGNANQSHRCLEYSSLDSVVAPFVYSPPLSICIHDFKYRKQRSLGRAFGVLLHEQAVLASLGVDALLPVPLHPSRLRERTYNQSDEIARSIAHLSGVRLLADATRRVVATPSQAALGTVERARNVRGAFRLKHTVSGLRIAIVDDVITTGATMDSLARVLLTGGATSVSAWAVARTL